MKNIFTILTLTLGLSLCNLNCTKKPSESAGTKEEIVKSRITELFDLCKAGKNSEAASYMMYRGTDQSRSGKDVAHPTDENERRQVDQTCAEIKSNLERSGKYDFGKFLSQTKGDGSEVLAWEVYFQQSPTKIGSIYAFSLLDGKYVLVDVDSIAGESSRPSTTDSTVDVRRELITTDSPPTRPGKITAGSAIPTGPDKITAPEMATPPPPPPPTPRRPLPIISGGVLNGRAISLPKPSYPPVAKAVHASGAVRVQVVVDEEGKVISATAVSGHPLLQAAAVQAARQAKFTPTKLSGQPIKVSGVIIYNFVAQ